jgi:hypothetical protein
MAVQPLPGAGAMANPPIRITQCDADTINPPALGQQTWQEAASPKYFLDLHGAGHLPPLQDGTPWFPGIVAASEAFLDAYLEGDGPVSGVAAAVGNAPSLSLQSG